MKKLILVVLFFSGCSLNGEIRYPWDKQKDKHEMVPVKAQPSPAPTPTPSPEPTATPTKLQFDISPLDEKDVKIAAKRRVK